MYYAIILDNELYTVSEATFKGENVQNIEITEEVFNNIDHYIWNGSEIVLNPNYEEEQAEKERERVGNLQVTKRVFALALQQLGITYSQLKELIASNEQAQLEWDLCVELQRKNPLLDVMAAQLGVSSETLDMIFKRANGEN